MLHLIFFHRYFTPLTPATHELLDLTLPYVSDVQVETQIEERATALQRQFDISSGAQGQRLDGGRGQVVVNFLERRRKKGWFGACADDDQIWETWILQVNVASPRSEPGMMLLMPCACDLTLMDLHRGQQGPPSNGIVSRTRRLYSG